MKQEQVCFCFYGNENKAELLDIKYIFLNDRDKSIGKNIWK